MEKHSAIGLKENNVNFANVMTPPGSGAPFTDHPHEAGMKDHNNKSVLVLGLGETGLSMVRWLSAQSARLRVADSRSAPPGLAQAAMYVAEEQIFCGNFNDALFDGIEMIAISPGVPMRDPAVERAIARGIEVVGDIELFARSLPKDNHPQILAITGANGKTTVTSMVEHLCRAAGKDTVAAGNISPAVLDVMLELRLARAPEPGFVAEAVTRQ